jgi:hypothetical protein
MHSESLVQLVGQPESVPSHAKGLHDGLPALPTSSTVHVPTLPLTEQLWQAPVQVALQHMPETQMPLVQASSPLQEVPFPTSITQRALLQ